MSRYRCGGCHKDYTSHADFGPDRAVCPRCNPGKTLNRATPDKAFAYLRVSGINQIEGDGFERQALAVMTYANQNDIDVMQIFREEGVSGKKELEDRPALQELLTALESQPEVKTILIERLDRLARDLMVQETILADLKKSGYTLISVAEPDLCVDDPSRKLMRQIFGAIAEYDRAMIVLKLRGARERTKKKEGRCEGNKPFGFYLGEQGTLEYIHLLQRMGDGAVVMASKLNLNEYPTRSGKPWSPAVVGKILRREQADREKAATCAEETCKP